MSSSQLDINLILQNKSVIRNDESHTSGKMIDFITHIPLIFLSAWHQR